MTWTRYTQALDSRRRTTIATRLMAGGTLLTLLPWAMASSRADQALEMAAPLGWLLFAVGASILVRRPWRRPPKQAHPNIGTREAVAGSANSATRASAAVPTMPTMPTMPAMPAMPTTPSMPSMPRRLDAGILRRIDCRRFEAVVEALFARTGFETRSQPHGPEGGVDVWLYSRGVESAPASMVQCKHRVDKRIMLDQLRELKAVMASRGVRRGHFAATSPFAPDAIAFARNNGIHLLDISGLLQMIAKLPEADQQALLAVATGNEHGGQPACAAESGASSADHATVLPFLRNAGAIRATA